MGDPKTLWLTVTNIVLGAAVLLVILGVATGVLCEVIARIRSRHSVEDEIDRDMREFFGDSRPRR